jgi:C4-dicarboxylate-specific signal transduction histidine kinase
MDTWLIILIVIAAVVVLAIALFAWRRTQERRIEGKRDEARELRTEAEVQAHRADARASLAEEEADRAERERAEAREQAKRADELDPDVDT